MTQEIEKCEYVSNEHRRLFDINAKMEIARKIVQICLESKYNKTDIINNYILRSQYFESGILKQLMANAISMHIKSRNKTFSSWLQQSISKRDLFLMENNAADKFSRDIMVQYYVRKVTVLSKCAFVNKLKKFACNRSLDVDAHTKTRGYKSKKLPHSTESIVIEDSEVRFARMKYLQSIQQYRLAGAHIVYIDTKVASSSGCFVEKVMLRNDTQQVLTLFQRAVSPVMGMLSKKTKEISIVLNLDTYDDLNRFLLDWIIETVMPQISTPSVFVLEDNMFCDRTQNGDTPTMYSSKKEMLNWLEVNDIPHSSNMHSAELFELVKKTHQNLFKKKYILDEILMSYGHKVLRRPQMTNYLDYFNTLWEKLTHKSLVEKLYLFNVTSLENWKSMDKALSEIEQNVLKDDIAVNNTIEKLLTYAKNEGITCDITQILYQDHEIDEFKMEDIVKII